MRGVDGFRFIVSYYVFRYFAVKKTTTDEEADGREGLDQTVGKRKGMCCTEGRPAQRLKRVFNGAA